MFKIVIKLFYQIVLIISNKNIFTYLFVCIIVKLNKNNKQNIHNYIYLYYLSYKFILQIDGYCNFSLFFFLSTLMSLES